MFKGYLLIALRNLRRHKLYSSINIFGLSLGIACCLLLAGIVVGITDQNKSIPNSDSLYRLELQSYTGDEKVADYSHSIHGSRLAAELSAEFARVTTSGNA